MFDKLLDIEKNGDILKYKFSFDNYLMWPIIRYRFISKAAKMYDEKITQKKPNKLEIIKYLFQVFFKYPHIKKQKDIVSFGNTVSNILIEENYFNRIHDYYNLIFPDNTLFFERPENLRYRTPRFFKSTYYHDYIKLMPLIKGKIFGKISTQQLKNIDEFINYLKDNFYVKFEESFYSNIKTLLINEEKMLKYRKKYYLKTLKKIKPKIVFLNAAHYGGESYIIKWAKELGITTAEFQHGVVSRNHPAYNYGEYLRNSEEYKKYVPDYFITYGEYWNKQIKIPNKTYVVGNPHFHESIKKYKNIKEEKNTIMIVSQGTNTSFFVKIAKELSKNFDNKTILFKLHPGEIPFENRYQELYSYSNIKIIKNGDIFKYIKNSEIIIGHNSTVLFEAYGFNKKIFVYNDESSRKYIPSQIGIRFNDLDELVNLMKTNKDNFTESENIDYFFNSKWKENYIKFIKKEVGISLNDKKNNRK